MPAVQVVEGYNVVKAMEACGSRSGDTSVDVMIADCGVLDSSERSKTPTSACMPPSSERGAQTAAAWRVQQTQRARSSLPANALWGKQLMPAR